MNEWRDRTRARWLALGVLVALASAGCSRGPKLVPVKGKLSVKGQPLPAGLVVYLPDAEKGHAGAKELRARSDQDGAYELSTDGQPGVPPGWYRVTVWAMKEPNAARPPEWLAHPRYSDPKTSGLTVEVKEGAPPGTYDFDLVPP
jgi:hypothetical protein